MAKIMGFRENKTMPLTNKEKAKMFDFLRANAFYDTPAWGYHPGGWKIMFCPERDQDCPNDFLKAIRQCLEDEEK
ncbi:MAG: hypothetical protein GY820_39070 [Gammaproteobacteria bacterium]|nr:hypothetical protein [Gammaproteobacteria bacterium]